MSLPLISFLAVTIALPYFTVGLAPSRVLQQKAGGHVMPLAMPSAPAPELSLEDLAYKYRTDKSKDDHAYVNLYNMILAPIRHQVRNVTEVGIATGQSLQMWHDYFSEAHIWGLDIENVTILDEVMAPYKDRVHMFQADSQVRGTADTIGLAPESMDLVIDDGDHRWLGQEKTLNFLFHLVKPGGYYAIEDVEWDRKDNMSISYRIQHHPEWLHPNTQAILKSNNAFFADPTLGHRAFKAYSSIIGPFFAKDRFRHNSHMVVIQKRKQPLHPVELSILNGHMEWDPDTDWGRDCALRRIGWRFLEKMEGLEGVKAIKDWEKPAVENQKTMEKNIYIAKMERARESAATATVHAAGETTVTAPSH